MKWELNKGQQCIGGGVGMEQGAVMEIRYE